MGKNVKEIFLEKLGKTQKKNWGEIVEEIGKRRKKLAEKNVKNVEKNCRKKQAKTIKENWEKILGKIGKKRIGKICIKNWGENY